MTNDVSSMRGRADREWVARLMASSEPWLTLGRDYAAAMRLLRNPAKKCYLVSAGGERAGFLILDPNGPLSTVEGSRPREPRPVGSRALQKTPRR